MASDSIERLRKFVLEMQKMRSGQRGTTRIADDFYGIHVGTPSEAECRVSDICAVLDQLDAAASTSRRDALREAEMAVRNLRVEPMASEGGHGRQFDAGEVSMRTRAANEINAIVRVK